jgi:hypothetical protein
VVAFGALSIFQQVRMKRQNREKLQALRQAAIGAADAPPRLDLRSNRASLERL